MTYPNRPIYLYMLFPIPARIFVLIIGADLVPLVGLRNARRRRARHAPRRPGGRLSLPAGPARRRLSRCGRSGCAGAWRACAGGSTSTRAAARAAAAPGCTSVTYSWLTPVFLAAAGRSACSSDWPPCRCPAPVMSRRSRSGPCRIDPRRREMYGVGGTPPERRLHEYGGRQATVDYPPVALYELAWPGGCTGRSSRRLP